MPDAPLVIGTRPSADPKVVVTGIGLATGLDLSREGTWAALRVGRGAARSLDDREPTGGLPDSGCPAPWADAPDDEHPDPVYRLLIKTTLEAMADADLLGVGREFEHAATLIGLSKGSIRSSCQAHRDLPGSEDDPDRVGRLWIGSWPSTGAHFVARWLRLGGPCLAPIAACATGLVAVLQAADWIRRGTCDWALAGSVDASLEPLLMAAFRKMKVLAAVDGDPATAIRPWDRRRSGFLVGEGGAILVLEREDHARARGVLPYAEVAGGALGSDAYHMTDLNSDPTNLADLIGRALETAGVVPEEVDHVNVHGTATRSNDPLECRAIRLALGRHADRVACTANKAQIGHLLGAAGSAELAITCLSIRDEFVPPTLNLTEPDPACDLDGTPLVGRSMPIRAALKLSLGFGGHLAAAVLRRPEGPRRIGPR